MSDMPNKINVFSVHHRVYPTDPEVYYFKVFIDVPPSIRAPVLDRLLLKAAGIRIFYGYKPTGEVVEFVNDGPLREFGMRKVRSTGVTRLFHGTFFTKTWLVNGEEVPVTEKIDLNPEELTKKAMEYKGLLY
jgi:hypothetical protein